MRRRGLAIGAVLVVLVGVIMWLVQTHDGGGDVALVAPRDVVASTVPDVAPEPDAPLRAPLDATAAPLAPRPVDDAAPLASFLVVDAVDGTRLTHGSIHAIDEPVSYERVAKTHGHWKPGDDWDDPIDGAFPDHLDVDDDVHVIWVGAPGHAWTPHALAQDGTRDVVALPRAGALRVDRGTATRGPLRVHVDDGRLPLAADGSFDTTELRHFRDVTFEPLATGSYAVEVTTPSTLGAGAVVFAGTVDVVAGETTDIVVPEIPPPTGDLEVVVLAGPDVPFDTQQFVALETPDGERLGGDNDADWWCDDEGHWHYEADDHLAAGDYVVRLGLGVAEPVTILPDQTARAVFDLRDHAIVDVSWTGAGSSWLGTYLRWTRVDAPHERGGSRRVRSGRSSLSVSVPPERVAFRIVGSEVSADEVVVHPAPGERVSVQLRCSPADVAKAAVLVVPTLTSPSPGSRGFEPRLEFMPLGHDGSLRFTRYREHRADGSLLLDFVFDTQGRYLARYPISWDEFATSEIEAGPVDREPVVWELR